MALYTFRPVANGLRTDHPAPDLPFIDDTHIPLEDPHAIEAVGRNQADDMWGRCDIYSSGGWFAYTTDPRNRDLAWTVRWHPDHGRTVTLCRNTDAASLQSIHVHEEPTALLFRAGGYWWDGSTWHRPAQIWDGATERFYRRPVPAAATVTAETLLQQAGVPDGGRILNIDELDADKAAPLDGRWVDHLALWASQRGDRSEHAVVTFTAPEINGDQLVGVAEMADIAGITASTLRSYISRNENDVPLPQAVLNGRNVWARPVAEEWAEQRRRSHEGLTNTVAIAHEDGPLPPGTAGLLNRFTDQFFLELWERPTLRKRWALRWRNPDAVRDVAKTLGWHVAGDLTGIVPVYDLATTVRHAVLNEFSIDWSTERSTSYPMVSIGLPVARMLDWLIRHVPDVAGHTIGEIIGEADRTLGIPRDVTERAIRSTLLDGTLAPDVRSEFLDRILSPKTN